jgi:glutamate/tyrosine decarboxylase-like PLP-dependent enzyme
MTMRSLLQATCDHAVKFIDTLPERPVARAVDPAELAAAVGGPLPEEGADAEHVIAHMVETLSPALVASPGPRYYGFVVGGALPAALAADWLTATWDQNAALYLLSPAAAVVEDVAAGWLRDLLGLPSGASVGFVTGGQMANFTGLASARDAVLRKVGWDVLERGLAGSPALTVVVGAQAHATIYTALRMLGIGRDAIRRIPADGEGRMRADALEGVLREISGPVIVCAQAGNVDTGAFDPFVEIAALTRAKGAWLHVDGAFGLWAAASPELRHLVRGVEQADSWGVDGHKWLNVPYDSGFAIVADPAAHRAAIGNAAAAYLVTTEGQRDGQSWAPESSRRARGFATYAALKSLGRSGVGTMIARCVSLAKRLADGLRTIPGVVVLNDVVLNQVLVRFERSGDNVTDAVIARLQHDAVCWAGPTKWEGQSAMRIAVSNWSTTEKDIEQTVGAIAKAMS